MAFFKKEEAREVEPIVEPVVEPVEKKEDKEMIWEVGEVTTQTAPIIINKNTGEQLGLYSALASIKNDLEYIKSFLKE